MRGLGGAPSGVLLPSSVNCGEALPAAPSVAFFKIDCAATPRQPAEHDMSGSTSLRPVAVPSPLSPRDLHSKLLSQARYFLFESTPLYMPPPWSHPANASGCTPPWVMFLECFWMCFWASSKCSRKYLKHIRAMDERQEQFCDGGREKERQRCSFYDATGRYLSIYLSEYSWAPALRFTKSWPTASCCKRKLNFSGDTVAFEDLLRKAESSKEGMRTAERLVCSEGHVSNEAL